MISDLTWGKDVNSTYWYTYNPETFEKIAPTEFWALRWRTTHPLRSMLNTRTTPWYTPLYIIDIPSSGIDVTLAQSFVIPIVEGNRVFGYYFSPFIHIT